MRRSLRRQLWLLRAYVLVSSLAWVVVATAAFQPAAKPQNLGEITVERINVVDKDGTLRMVISDKDRMHPGVIDGKVIDRPRPVAGLLFFNDEGVHIIHQPAIPPDCLAESKAASNATAAAGKSSRRQNAALSVAPCTRSMRLSSHSTLSGPA